MNVAVNPGLGSSSARDMAQNPSVNKSRSTLLCCWIWPYPQWWLVNNKPSALTISAVHPPLK